MERSSESLGRDQGTALFEVEPVSECRIPVYAGVDELIETFESVMSIQD